MMKQRSLGQSKVPAVGLGCMGMSEFYGPVDERANLALLDRAVEAGYRHFDTADMYAKGGSERLLGEFIRHHRRDELFIASKFGICRPDDDPANIVLDGSAAYVRRACEQSLGRLGVDYLDLYYLHRRDRSVPIEETVGAMAELVSEGLVRGIGLSEVSVETYRRAHGIHPVTAVQSEYSLLSREPEEGMLQACRENGTAFVAYSPMSRGLLSGVLRQETLAREGDIRPFLPRFAGENRMKNQALVLELQDMAAAKGVTVAQLALAWVLHQGEHLHIIPGTRTEQYLRDNFRSMEVSFSALELAELRECFAPSRIAGERYPEFLMADMEG